MLLISTANVGFGQANIYHPFPDSAACWHENYLWGTICAVNENQYHVFGSDTVIGLYNYHTLLMSGSEVCYGYPPTYKSGKHFIRQDILQKKVYTWAPGFYTDTVLYDFTLVAGNVFHNGMWGYTVTLVDSVLMGDGYHKRLWTNLQFSTINNGDSAVSIIEGVGSTLGLFFSNQGVEYGSVLTSNMQNSQCIYKAYMASCSCSSIAGISIFDTQTDVITIAPNPTFGNFTLQSQKKLGMVYVYNVNGEMVYSNLIEDKSKQIDLSNLSAGIYFIQVQGTHKKIIKE